MIEFGDRPGGLVLWHHTSTVVTDIDATLAFHREVFGLEVLFAEYGVRDQIQAMLGLDGISCDLMQTAVPGTGHVQEFIAFYDLPLDCDPWLPVRPGQGHIAYIVTDIEDALRVITQHGGHAIGKVTDFEEGPAVYCWLPTGGVLELEQRR